MTQPTQKDRDRRTKEKRQHNRETKNIERAHTTITMLVTQPMQNFRVRGGGYPHRLGREKGITTTKIKINK